MSKRNRKIAQKEISTSVNANKTSNNTTEKEDLARKKKEKSSCSAQVTITADRVSTVKKCRCSVPMTAISHTGFTQCLSVHSSLR